LRGTARPKRTTRKDLVLKARAGEFEAERSLEEALDCAFQYVPPEEDLRKMPTDCRRFSYLAQCCDACHDYCQLERFALLSGEVVSVCCWISEAIRPWHHQKLRQEWLQEHMATAGGRKFLATTWLSLFPFDQATLFALEAWNEAAPEGEKVDYITTMLAAEES
jgi:hypothetical protein